ncbi:hypothetical protein YTPLAS73_00810 [Nitrosarchaeum sp.]|nr:hypothetical protein YTPLAS73_00810 [Nitrosarchaeum sp.]
MKLKKIIFIVIGIAISGTLIGLLNSTDDSTLNNLKKQAEFASSVKEYEKAITYYDKILVKEPHSTQILSEKGNALMALDKFEYAIETFDLILNLEPTNIDAQKNKERAIQLSILESTNSSKIQKIKIVNNTTEITTIPIIEESPDINIIESPIIQEIETPVLFSITNEIIEANSLVEEEKYDEAIFIYEQVLINEPSNTYALNGKAYAYYLKAITMHLPGLFFESIDTYKQTLEKDADNINALVGIASSFVETEEYDQAIFYYRLALAVEPENRNAKNGLFSLWIKQGNEMVRYFYMDSANEFFDKVLEIDSNNTDALNAKAGSHIEWGKTDQAHYNTAVDLYTRVLEINPNDIKALVGMGYVLSKQLKFEEAVIFYDKALEIDPNNNNAMSGKSFALNRIK